MDPFDRVRLVMDRFAIHDAIRDISLPGLAVTVRAPKAIRVSASSLLSPLVGLFHDFTVCLQIDSADEEA